MTKRARVAATDISRIVEWLQQHEDEMATLLAELVAIPTENPPGKNYRACADLLEDRLRQEGLECERFETGKQKERIADGPVCLIGNYGRGKRVLYFHGHYDVVPAQSPEQFLPTRKKHYVFGRGSCDMKGGIVAMLYAVLALKECGAELDGRIALTLVPNEETGGEGGSAWLASQGRLGRGGIGMLLAEPTSGIVWNANRGAISLRVRILGKSAHVSLQHQGENAFERMHRVVHRLGDLKRQVEKHLTGHHIDVEQERNSILMLGGQSGGGANFNVVPEECWFTIDRRINPEENLKEEKARLIAVLEACEGEEIPLEWEVLQEGHASACRSDEALGGALVRGVKAVTGEAPRFEMCPGLLEIRFYAERGIPAFAYGPGLLSVAHGPNEYVDLRKVIECAAVYALTAKDMLQQ
jgi:acetylornithine deacetylase/succinyl-diaminopimelate desuccinylase family protein